jgi:hypothetical protein
MWWVRVRFLPPLVVAATVLAGFGLGHCPGCCGALAVPAAGRDSGQRDHHRLPAQFPGQYQPPPGPIGSW